MYYNVYFSGVAGGTASGKSTVCKRIIEKLGQADINERQRQVKWHAAPRRGHISKIIVKNTSILGCINQSRQFLS